MSCRRRVIRVSNNAIPIDRNSFDAQTLMINHPPKWRNRNKLVAFERAFPGGSDRQRYNRVLAVECDTLAASLRRCWGCEHCSHKAGIFDYLPEVDGAVEWHVNFADDDLFVAYAGNLLAQDELQVLEHPADFRAVA